MVKGTYSLRPGEEMVGPISQSSVARIARFVFEGEGNLQGIHPQVIWAALKEIERRTNVPGEYFVGFETTNPAVRARRLQIRFSSIKKLKGAKEEGDLDKIAAIVMDSRHDLDIRQDAAWEFVELAQTIKHLETFLRTVAPIGSYFGGSLARAGQKMMQLKYEERELGTKRSFGPQEAPSKKLGKLLRK